MPRNATIQFAFDPPFGGGMEQGDIREVHLTDINDPVPSSPGSRMAFIRMLGVVGEGQEGLDNLERIQKEEATQVQDLRSPITQAELDEVWEGLGRPDQYISPPTVDAQNDNIISGQVIRTVTRRDWFVDLSLLTAQQLSDLETNREISLGWGQIKQVVFTKMEDRNVEDGDVTG